jgi:hypothetical protein
MDMIYLRGIFAVIFVNCLCMRSLTFDHNPQFSSDASSPLHAHLKGAYPALLHHQRPPSSNGYISQPCLFRADPCLFLQADCYLHLVVLCFIVLCPP